jgi:predicted nucleic acid-binding protein
MPTFVVDTSCIVAAVCTWHEHHRAATGDIDRRLDRGDRLATPAAALVEAYAVLTRLPAPSRLSPHDAWALVHANFVEPAIVVALSRARYVALLRRLAKQAVAGGRTYDAVIAECAHDAKAGTLLTFNPRHFDPPPDGVSIIDPSESPDR